MSDCDIQNPKAWGEQNPVTLYPNQWQRWIIAISDEKRTELAAKADPARMVVEYVKDALGVWFSWSEGAGKKVPIGEPIVGVGTPGRPGDFELVRDIVATGVQPTAGELDTALFVEFPYYGDKTNIRWPALNEGLYQFASSDRFNPCEAEIYLLAYAKGEPADRAGVPMPSRDTPEGWLGGVKGAITDLGAFASSQGTKTAVVIGGLAALATMAIAWKLTR